MKPSVGAAIVSEKKWAQALGAELIDLAQAFRWEKGKSVSTHMYFYYRACLRYNISRRKASHYWEENI